ncbi:hypothetical protein N0V90_011319 [Kalmusia sp. IMI 367209]|nr:hypothetical protein N0V90_011319 [Kalmusia sp. IMI 367209]
MNALPSRLAWLCLTRFTRNGPRTRQILWTGPLSVRPSVPTRSYFGSMRALVEQQRVETHQHNKPQDSNVRTSDAKPIQDTRELDNQQAIEQEHKLSSNEEELETCQVELQTAQFKRAHFEEATKKLEQQLEESELERKRLVAEVDELIDDYNFQLEVEATFTSRNEWLQQQLEEGEKSRKALIARCKQALILCKEQRRRTSVECGISF